MKYDIKQERIIEGIINDVKVNSKKIFEKQQEIVELKAQIEVINKKFKNPYDGIIFFSPSAVLSFFENNKWPKDSHGFCIGKSTAETLKKYTTNYSEAKHPNEDQLLQTIIIKLILILK